MLKKFIRRLVPGALAVLALAVSGCSDEPTEPRASSSAETAAEPLALLRFGPQGDLSRLTQITAMFNQPMVPLGAYDQAPQNALKLTPDIPGRRVWLNQYTLAFVPDKPLTGSHHVSAVLRAGHIPPSLSGARLKENAEAEIRLPLLGVESSQPLGERGLDPETALAPGWQVVFNQPPDPADLSKRAFFIWSADGKEHRAAARAAQAKGQGRDGLVFEFIAPEPLPRDTAYRLVLSAGAKSLAGPVPAPELTLAEGRTYGPFTISWDDPDNSDLVARHPNWGPPALVFSNPVDLVKVLPLLSLSPEYDLEPLIQKYKDIAGEDEGEENLDRFQRRLFLPGRLKGETDYTLTLDPAARDLYGQPLQTAEPLTFRTRAYPPEIEFSLDDSYGLLETASPPMLRLAVTNLPQVEIEGFALTAEEAVHFLAAGEENPERAWTGRGHAYNCGGPAAARALQALRPVSMIIPVPDGARDGRQILPLDLARLFGGNRLGHFLVIRAGYRNQENEPRQICALAQISDLGLTVKTGPESGLIWVTDLAEARAWPGADLELLDGAGNSLWRGQSSPDGLAPLPGLEELFPDGRRDRRLFVTARAGGQMVLWPLDWQDSLANWRWPVEAYNHYEAEKAAQEPNHWLLNALPLYRPGETAKFKLIARQGRGDLMREPVDEELDIELRNPFGEKAAQARKKTGPFGTLSHEFPLPSEGPLGDWTVWVGPADGELNQAGSFQVLTYRPPAFEIKIEGLPDKALAGDRTDIGIKADYHFGAPVAGRPANYSAYYLPAPFRLPGPYADYSIKDNMSRSEEDDGPETPEEAAEVLVSDTGGLDRSGSLEFSVDLIPPAGRPPRPRFLTANVTVTDVDNRPVSTSGRFLVHPAALYAGLSAPFLGRVGEDQDIKFIAADLEGRPVPGVTADLKLYRRNWLNVRRKTAGSAYEYISRLTDEKVAETILTSGEGPVIWTVTPDQPGQYWVRAELKDSAGRLTRAAESFYLAGAGEVGWLPGREDEPLTLLPDKREYKPGETARILVQSPFDQGEGLLTVERAGLRRSETFRLTNSAPVLEVPIEAGDTPNVFVSVLLARGRLADRPDQKNMDFGKPMLRAGYAELAVPSREALLDVKVEVQPPEVGPGEEVTVNLTVTDHLGRPSPQAEVALIAADAAVIQLAGDSTYHPAAWFNRAYPLLVQTASNLVSLVGRDNLGLKARDPGGGGGLSSEQAEGLRRLFAALAFFEPSLTPDQSGRVSAKIKMPENLTTFKIFAVATGHGRISGTGQSSVLVTRDLLVRQSLPNYAAPGDEFSASAVVSNRGDQGGQARVTLAGENFTLLESEEAKTVAVEPGQSLEVAFRVQAGPGPEAKFRFGVDMGRDRDRAEFTLPVIPAAPLTTQGAFERFTESGKIELAPPPGADPSRGGLEVELAPSLLGVMHGPLEWLQAYPHNCVEQTVSRAWAELLTLTLADRLGTSPERAETARQRVSAALARLDEWEVGGGYNNWPGQTGWSNRSVYLTAYVLDFRLAAREAGFEGNWESPAYFLRLALAGNQEKAWPTWHSPEAVRSARLYALAQLARAGDNVAARLEDFLSRPDDLNLFQIANLLRIVHFQPALAGRDMLKNSLLDLIDLNLVLTPAGAAPADQGQIEHREIWASPSRTTALVIQALAEAAPEHPRLPGLVRGLVASARKDHFGDTHSTAAALSALASAGSVLEPAPPDMAALVRLGQGPPLIQGTFQSFRDQPLYGRAALSDIEDGAELNIDLEGQGQIWTAARLKSAPAQPDLTAWSSGGFNLSRDFTAMAPEPGQPGADHFKRGQVVRASIALVVPEARYNVVLEDHVPAGFEPVNFNLADADRTLLDLVRPEDDEGTGRPRFWYDHQEIWPDRVAVYIDYLPPGVYTFNYLARAATIGRYLTPGPRAEEMYAPENAGRGAGHIIVVEE